jgi:sterol carrier protein 2
MPVATSPDGFKSEKIFDTLSAILAEDGKTLVRKVKGIYGFKVKGGPNGSEGFWIVDAKNGLGSVEFNGKGRYVSLYLSDEKVTIWDKSP